MIHLLVVLSALLHAWWNARLKRVAGRDGAAVAALAAATGWAALAALGRRLAHGPPPFPNAGAWGWALAAGLGEAAYFALLAAALKRGPLGPVYTLARGGAILAVWPLSVLWFAEPVGWRAALATAVLLAGLLLAGGGAAGAGAGRAPAAAGALAIAGYHLAYKAALAAGGEPAAVFALSMGLAVPLNGALLAAAGHAAGARALWRERPLWLAATGAICAGSFLIFLVALGRGGAGFVLTLRNVSIVFALLFARAQGERSDARQWIGAALATLGAAGLG